MKNLLFILIFLTSFNAISQNLLKSGESGLFRPDFFTTFAQNGVNNGYNPVDMVSFNSNHDVKGSYYFSDEFLPGSVTQLSTNKTQTGFIVFDVYNGAMIMSLYSSGKDAFLVKFDKDILIEFDDRNFKMLEYSDGGKSKLAYMEILDNLKNDQTLAILHTRDKKSNKRIVSNIEFYLIANTGVAIRLKNDRNEILSEIDNVYKSQIDNYIASNNIRFENDYKGLIAVAKYYASLK